MVKNALGRKVPVEVNGETVIPFKGVGKHRPRGKQHAPRISTAIDYPNDGNKCVDSLATALKKASISNNMTISTHHHLRNGDYVANQVFEFASKLGIKNLTWLPSASFPCHEPIIEQLKDGTINHIEGSMNGPLGKFTSEGKMKGIGVLRSHGGRYQAIQDGEVKIDIAVLAAPTADPFGNAHGLDGPSSCGGLGYALPDYKFADKVIVVTDNLVDFPAMPMHIEGNYVDYVVEVDKIGDHNKIVSGTTRITRSPDRLLIAEYTARFCKEAGIIRDGFSFQMGAGGISLAVADFFHKIMKDERVKARFAIGGTTQYAVRMLEEGYLEYLLDAQTFDLEAVDSMRRNRNHRNISIFHAYDYHSKGFFNQMIDVLTLGATEVDVNFNGNVNTHSDGYLLHGIGGWQNCLFAKCTILPIPLFRNRIPIIKDEVTTVTGPGKLIDVIVTERGIAINPRRQDLLDKVKDSDLPIRDIHELKEEAEKICGKPAKPQLEDNVVAIIKWVDGTVIDAVGQVKLE
ncbi:MAG: citrate lyase subunit alpha [Candidatus Marinimicrobia bacterium]|nr:citrate lyase subunit alpha [Candidatus Neomarinimicrobiota bacterium]